jgi:MFS family permease
MNVFWMAGNFFGASITSLVIPSMVVKYLGDANKDINLPLVVIWGTIVSLVVSPVIGAISDHVTFRMGRRRPFLLIGTALTVLVLLAFAFSPTWVPNSLLLLVFALLSVLLHLSTTLAGGPLGAIIADRVPKLQRGLASGFHGLFSSIGMIAGSVAAGTRSCYLSGNLVLLKVSE